MRLNSKIYFLFVLIFSLLVGIIVLVPDWFFEKAVPKHKLTRNVLWEDILRTKKLKAITSNNSTNYFIYKGRPMGYQYDLLREYCRVNDLELEIIVEDDFYKSLNRIKNGEAAVLAMDITYTKARKKYINFTVSHGTTRQVLVQRRKGKGNAGYVKSVLGLDGKKVYIQKGTVFKKQLEYLREQTGAEFKIVEDKTRTMEDLIEAVANGEIDYTACDERVAMANKTYLPNIDFGLCLSVRQKLCWAVPPREDSLKISINKWLTEFMKTRKFTAITNKYFTKNKVKHLVDKRYLPGKGGSLSPYDDLIKKYSKEIGWDWRLLTSLIYQESRFNPSTVSWAGAVGLMQIMPETGKRMGVENVYSAEGNIRAGVKFLRWLDKQLPAEITDTNDRIEFVLAAYNVGLGHVLDARRLAEKNDKNPNLWNNNVDTFIVLKSKPAYYRDPVVRYGYCRGSETYNFVREIIARYNDYKNLVPE